MKRLVAGVLWFYSIWYLGSVISNAAGLPDLLGPILGVAAGLIVAVDPRHAIWRRRPSDSNVARA